MIPPSYSRVALPPDYADHLGGTDGRGRRTAPAAGSSGGGRPAVLETKRVSFALCFFVFQFSCSKLIAMLTPLVVVLVT